jgi:hypothetical protein
MSSQTNGHRAKWQLVEVPLSPTPLPGVVQARQEWAGQWVCYRVGRPGRYTWRRARVQRITNNGEVILSEMRGGQLVPVCALEVQLIPLLLKHRGQK